MAKVTLDSLANLTNETTAIETINTNMDRLEEALDNTLSRDGDTPNMMEADLDMNGQRIFNLPAPVQNSDALRLQDLVDFEDLGGITIPPVYTETQYVYIPSDYSTMQGAVDATYVYATDQNIRIIIVIETGHAITHGLKVVDGDFSRYYIRYEADGIDGENEGDNTVSLDPAFQGVDDFGMDGNSSGDCLILGYNCKMPVLACRIDMDNLGDEGYYAVWNCTGLVRPNCGVINAGGTGLEVRSSVVSAYNTYWNGATIHGVRAAHGAVVAVQNSHADDCMQGGAPESGGALDVSRSSRVHARSMSLMRSGANGANIRRASSVCLEEAFIDDATHTGVIVQQASHVSLWGSSIDDTLGFVGSATISGHGLIVTGVSIVDARNCSITGSGADIGGALDVFVGDPDALSGGGIVLLQGTTLTDGGQVEDVRTCTNLENVNTPYSRGIIYFGDTAGPLNFIGVFDDVGATNGKAFEANALLSSSRSISTIAQHYTFYNTNGQVGSIATTGTSSRCRTTSSGEVWYGSGTQTPEGNVGAGIGSVYTHVSGTAGATLYVKESGTGTAGWQAMVSAGNALILNVADQALTGGVRITAANLGLVSVIGATVTLDPGDRPIQYYTNDGAHTLAPGVNPGLIQLKVLNTTGAAVPVTSGFTYVTGDVFDTTITSIFLCSYYNDATLSHLHVTKLL
jgi:hypothetical protein